jgi:hypothetical protein
VHAVNQGHLSMQSYSSEIYRLLRRGQSRGFKNGSRSSFSPRIHRASCPNGVRQNSPAAGESLFSIFHAGLGRPSPLEMPSVERCRVTHRRWSFRNNG